MAETPKFLIVQFLQWVATRRRTYDETMEAWQSHCPRHTTWEDAVIEGLVRIDNDVVILTARGETFLNDARPQADGTSGPETISSGGTASAIDSANGSARALLGAQPGWTSIVPAARGRCG